MSQATWEPKENLIGNELKTMIKEFQQKRLNKSLGKEKKWA